MRTSDKQIDCRVADLLAQVKAIRLAVQCGSLSYNDAKKRAEPLLDKVNAVAKIIARKYKRKFREIKFHDL